MAHFRSDVYTVQLLPVWAIEIYNEIKQVLHFCNSRIVALKNSEGMHSGSLQYF